MRESLGVYAAVYHYSKLVFQSIRWLHVAPALKELRV
jgi:hypothetical protein